MVRTLASEVEMLEVETADAAGLAAMLTVLRRAQALVAGAVVRIGVRADELAATGSSPPGPELFGADGAVRGRTARDEAARSVVMRRLPALVGPVRAGRVGPDQLDALAQGLRGLDDDEFARLDGEQLAADAQRLPADTFAAAVRRAAREAAPASSGRNAEAKRRASTFRHWFDERTGMGCFRGELDPERFERLTTAIDRRTAALAAAAGDKTAKTPNLAASALLDLVERSASGPGGPSSQVIVVVGDGIDPQTAAGHELSDAAVGRLTCDGLVRRVRLDRGGVPIDVGRARRTATDGQWAAIRALHHSCAWAGCEKRIDWCQLHHIVPWSAGGATDLDNLVPLCSEHHHRVHEGGWSIELLADRSLRITRPDGVVHAVADPPTRSRAAPAPEPVPRGPARPSDPGERPTESPSRPAPALG
ncbi:MAG: HNH endonuclease [Actinomycetota bacterium]